MNSKTIAIGVVSGICGFCAIWIVWHLWIDHQNLHALVNMVNQQAAKAAPH